METRKARGQAGKWHGRTSFPDLGILSYKIMEKIVQVYVFAWPTRIRDLAEVGFNKFERSYQYFEPNVTDCSTKS